MTNRQDTKGEKYFKKSKLLRYIIYIYMYIRRTYNDEVRINAKFILQKNSIKIS